MLNDYGRFTSVTSLLDQLSWPTLQTRRKVTRLHILHKKVFCRQLSLAIPPYYLPATQSTRQYYPLLYILPYLFSMAHQNSYSSRMISDWNLLPVATPYLSNRY